VGRSECRSPTRLLFLRPPSFSVSGWTIFDSRNFGLFQALFVSLQNSEVLVLTSFLRALFIVLLFVFSPFIYGPRALFSQIFSFLVHFLSLSNFSIVSYFVISHFFASINLSPSRLRHHSLPLHSPFEYISEPLPFSLNPLLKPLLKPKILSPA